MITGTLVGVNIWGILHLEQNFDPNWYVRENSYVSEYFNAMKRYFPENGERASIYTGSHFDAVALLQCSKRFEWFAVFFRR